MLAALKWIKWAGLASVFVVIICLWVSLQRSNSELSQLKVMLNKAEHDNKTNIETIASLKSDAELSNQIIVERTRQYQRKKQELNDEIETLKSSVKNIECVIPAAVTEQLRSSY